MLAETKSRSTAIIMAGAIALALTGCYTMKTEVVYHAGGTVDSTVLVATDDAALAEQYPDISDPAQAFVDSATTGPDMEALRDQFGDRLTIEPYVEDGQSGVFIAMRNATLDEVAELNSKQGAPAGETSVTHADGRITLDYTSNAALMGGYDDALASLGESGLDSSALAAYVDFEARHTFPGRVISTTIGEIDPKNPNSVLITDLAEVTDSQHYTIVASDSAGGADGALVLWIVIAGLLALAVVAGVIVWRVRASRKADAVPAAALLVDDAIVPAPLGAPAVEPGEPATIFSPEDVTE